MDLITMVLACSLYPDHSIINAMAEVGSHNDPLVITSNDNKTSHFKTSAQAADYALSRIQQGDTVATGLMQVSSRWLEDYQITPDELTQPCRNMVIATKILTDAETQCAQLPDVISQSDKQACALSVYKTGDPQAGLDYAKSVINYAEQHPFDKIVAAAEAKNPRSFHMSPNAAPVKKTTKR